MNPPESFWRPSCAAAALAVGLLALPSLASAETLQEYSAACDLAIGVTVPDFVCDEGTIIPTTNHANGKCDQPNRLNRTCDPDSRFLVLHSDEDAYIVASCRKQGRAEGYFGDIAVIQHNLNSGATCFYQALGTLSGDVKAPSKGTGPDGYTWYPPADTAGIGCAGCHDNGPLMRSPYVAQIEGSDALPSSGDSYWNSESDPYWCVGEDFDDWKTYTVEVTGNACTSCHRMGTNNLFEPAANG